MEQFVVSARKYRPATFQSVVGQGHITETLKNAIQRGHLAHAYLFTGPRGVGKTTCARIFAKAINCMNPTPDHEACGECESCKAFNEGRSFSIHELDAASNNSVEDIRALTEKVRIPPQVGRYSVYIIDEVHMLSAAAFNAFLKTLEEPPHYAVFILATTEKHKILPTILSRCQCYDFNRIRVEDMVKYLQYIADTETVGYDDEALHIIAQRADGGMRDALSMFDRVVSFCGNQLTGDKVAESLNVLDYNTYFEATDLILKQDYAALLTLFDGILRRGFEGQLFIAGLNGHMRDLLVCKSPQTSVLLEVTGNVAERYRTQAKECDAEFLFNAINLLTQTDTGYRLATNRRLHTELALIKLCGLKKKADRADLAADALAQLVGVAKYPMPAISAQQGGVQAASAPAAPETKPTVSEPQAPHDVAPSAAPVEKTNPSSAVSEAATVVREKPETTPEATIPKPEQSPEMVAAEAAIPLEETAVLSTPDATPALAEPTKTERKTTSVTGISISTANQAAKASPVESEQETTPEDEAPAATLSGEEIQQRIGEKYDDLVALWEKRQRPRIATALTNRTLSGNTVTITVPTEVAADEMNQAKWEIEQDIRTLTGGIRGIVLQVVVDENQPQVYKPVSTEDKLQYLVDMNPNLLKLRDELDLTI